MTSQDIEVDIVIATNRASPFLDEALASVVAQTHRAWRLIVVDDGSPSPEFTRAAVGRIENAVVIRQKPSGQASARNRGIDAGRAPLVAFLDDDDVWTPDKLERQVRAWTAAPERVAVYSAGWYMHGDGTRFGTGWEARQTPSSAFLAGEVPPPRIVSLLVRRDACVTVGGFDVRYRATEDNEFILRLAGLGEMTAVPHELVGYRRHEGNVSWPGLIAARRESARYLAEHGARALACGDEDTAQLLRAHARRYRRTASEECITGVGRAMRRRDARALLDEVVWAVRSAPGAAFVAAARRVLGRARYRRRPRADHA